MSETVERRLIEGCWGDAYSASSDGQIWSSHPQSRGRPLSQRVAVHGYGYAYVGLAHRGSRFRVTVHRLVALAFLGPRPDGMYVCHNDGDRLNNRIENLRYDTPSSNCFDTVRHGTNRNAGKEHCHRGHPFDEANTYRRQDRPGNRECRACRAAYSRRAYVPKGLRP